jgi:hypothetical protein
MFVLLEINQVEWRIEWQPNVEPGALHPASPLLRSVRAHEAQHGYHPRPSSFLQLRFTPIPNIENPFNPMGEVVAKDAGGLVSRPKSLAAHSSLLAFEYPLPRELGGSHHPRPTTRTTTPRSSHPLARTPVNTGRQNIATIPSRTHTQVVFADTSAPEGPDSHRQAYLANEEDVEHPSALSSQILCMRTLFSLSKSD